MTRKNGSIFIIPVRLYQREFISFWNDINKSEVIDSNIFFSHYSKVDGLSNKEIKVGISAHQKEK